MNHETHFTAEKERLRWPQETPSSGRGILKKRIGEAKSETNSLASDERGEERVGVVGEVAIHRAWQAGHDAEEHLEIPE